MQIGAAGLADDIGRYNGSYVLAFAGYNASRGRVQQWVAQHGDPRDPKVDAVDWVERIPFAETRNYVQRVMENLQRPLRRPHRDRPRGERRVAHRAGPSGSCSLVDGHLDGPQTCRRSHDPPSSDCGGATAVDFACGSGLHFAEVPGGLKCSLVPCDTVRASAMWLCACRGRCVRGL